MEKKTEEARLLEQLASNKKAIDKVVLDFLPRNSESPEIGSLYSMMRDYPSRGGKGLRGTLCLMFCDLFGGKTQSAITTAAGLELFQNWILIHDDIEDQSDLRRGLPALHKKFGVELAINTGDALHGKMWELLLSNARSLGDSVTINILSEFTRMLNETTEGQHIELAWTCGNNWSIEESDYFLMVIKKSAWYTCISPARLGLYLSKSNASRVEPLSSKDMGLLNNIVKMGTDLGIAFQIIDDVLNLTADETKYGKEILGDIFEGKRTLMLIHLLDSIGESERRKVISLLSKSRQEKTSEDVHFVFEKMKQYGSIDYARKVAHTHSQRGLKEFDDIASECSPHDAEITVKLRGLLGYLSSREY